MAVTKAKSKYYAVAVGRVPGVYGTWEECKKMVDGVVNAKYKKFGTLGEAEAFVKHGAAPILAKLGVQVEGVGISAKIKSDDDVSQNKDALVAFTDGSALHNGKKNAVAGWAVVFPNHMEKNCSSRLQGAVQTNNRAEYQACIRALEIADEIDPGRMQTLYVYTDSMLLIRSMTMWLSGWKKNRWIKSNGEPVLNVDLLMELDRLLMGRRVKWNHVEAHTGREDWASKYNDMVDKMARASVQKGLI